MKCSDLPHPQQPIGFADDGAIRFKENKIISSLFERGVISLNDLRGRVVDGEFSEGDYVQLTQLIGYSVSGWGGLSTSPPDMVATADAEARRLTALADSEGRAALNEIVKFLAHTHPEIPFTGDVPQYVQRVVRSLQERAQQPDLADLQWAMNRSV